MKRPSVSGVILAIVLLGVMSLFADAAEAQALPKISFQL